MAANQFEVKPVLRYDGARYPSPWAPVPTPGGQTDARLRPGLQVVLLLIALVVGMALGWIGCFVDYRTEPCLHGPRDASGACPGPDPDPDCTPGALVCDQLTLWTCNQAGSAWTSQDCEELCNQRGGLDAYSQGCDPAAEDPCLCEYDIIDGDIAECRPGEFVCLEDGQVQICNQDYWSWTTQDCNEYCRETHGPEFVSYGCQQDAEEPCLCDYDMLDGVWAGCQPGEVYCADEETLMVCADSGWDYDQHVCADYCVEVFGEEYLSNGCDASDADNPCGCEYGIVDGEPVEP